jgi:hypothetical protein
MTVIPYSIGDGADDVGCLRDGHLDRLNNPNVPSAFTCS